MRALFPLFFCLIPLFSPAQVLISDENKTYFNAPLKTSLFLSGNFGELRNNHFHAGIDLKTEGREGLKVYAPADGVISRIKVSAYGYGLALYINHPNGYTTVYGHLSNYNATITAYVRDIQYQKQSFDIDVEVPADLFPVKQGDVIAYSGNTGGSGGPHLHFEIRETESEHPINPLLFSFNIKDSTPPVIKGLMLYPLSKNASINGKHAQQQIPINEVNGKYIIADNKTISANGAIGLGISALDFLDGSSNRCGIFENTLQINGETLYSFRMDKFEFSGSRYINSFIDYAYLQKNQTRYQKCFVDMNNGMINFSLLRNNGIFNIEANETKAIDLKVTDVYGNLSSLKFNIYGEEEKVNLAEDANGSYLNCFYPQEIQTSNAKASFKENTFYNDLLLENYELCQAPNTYSPTIVMGNIYIPVHQEYTLSIKAYDLPVLLQSKAVIVAINDNNTIKKYLGGTYQNGWVESKVKELGKFAIAVDIKPPTIKALSIDNNISLNNPKQINFRIEDAQSGIKSWRGEIDGEWVLFQYEYKQKKLFYVFDESRLSLNKQHTLKLEVSDGVGNTSTYQASFYK